MQEAFVRRIGNHLEPGSQNDEDIIKAIPANKLHRIQVYDVKEPRSVAQLNMFWACCQTVADNTEDPFWNTKEKVAFQLKVALSFIDLKETIVTPAGVVHFKYRSISFAELPHMEACKFFDRAWPIMADKIGITVEKLLENSRP